MPIELRTELPRKDYPRILREIYSKPIDFFDYFVHSENISLLGALGINLIFWLYAGVCKILHNVFLIYVLARFQEDTESAPKITAGVATVLISYPVIFLLLTIFQIFKKAYQEKYYLNSTQNLIFISYLPFSASCIFWLLPAPFSSLLVILSFLYSCKLYYEGVIHVELLEPKHLWNIIFLFISFLLFLSFIGLSVLSYLRS